MSDSSSDSSDTDTEGEIFRFGGMGGLKLDKATLRNFSVEDIKNIVTTNKKSLQYIIENKVNKLSNYEVIHSYKIAMIIKGDVHVMFDTNGMTMFHKNLHEYHPYDSTNLEQALASFVQSIPDTKNTTKNTKRRKIRFI